MQFERKSEKQMENRFIKKPPALVKRSNLFLYIPFLAIITISVVIYQIKK